MVPQSAGRARFGPGESERALAVACEAARRAGRVQLEHYERLERVEHKGVRDVVTEVDRACEALIMQEIRAAFPRDAILAEESGVHRGLPEGTVGEWANAVEADPPEIELSDRLPGGPTDRAPGSSMGGVPGGATDRVPGGPTDRLPGGPTDRAPGDSTDRAPGGPTDGVPSGRQGESTGGAAARSASAPAGEPSAGQESGEGGDDPTGGARRAWIVDPLDGTINYANGIPFFCVCIGLSVAGEVVLGVVYDPVRDELFTATRGHGARLNGRQIGPPDKPLLSDYVVSLGMPARGNAQRRRRLGRSIRAVRNMGSAGLSLTYVANGRFDAFIQVGGLSNWDVAGPGCIAREAGAVVTGAAGEQWFDLTRATRTISIVAATPRYHGTLLEALR